MQKGVPLLERLFAVLISVLREVLFKIVYSESHGVARERFAHVGRIGLLKTSGAQVAAEQRTEAGRKSFGKTVGYLHHILFLHFASSRTYAYEHKSAFNKAALGAEASASVQAYGRIENLRLYLYAEFFPKAEKGGNGAVEVFVVVQVMNEFIMVGHVHSLRKVVTEGGTPVQRCRQGCGSRCFYPELLPE